MLETRRNLKLSSILVLVFAGLSVLNLVLQLCLGGIDSVPGLSAEGLKNAKIVILIVTLVLTIPEIYIGVKGLSFAKNPDGSKAHIILAKIFFVLSVLAIIDPIINLFKNGGAYENVTTLLSIAVQVLVYFDYVRYAIAVSREN